MKTWHQPPIAKVYEALGALADERVKAVSATSAEVMSSSGDKSYTVEWAEDFSWMSSNDNASFWQGYLGYPIVAVLLQHGKIRYDKTVSEALKGVPWKTINTHFKNNYEKTISEVLDQASRHGPSRESIITECERIHSELSMLKIERPAGERKRPPVGKQPEPSAKQASQRNLI